MGTIHVQTVCVWYDGKTQAGVPLEDLQTIVEMEKLLLSACVRSKEVVIPEIVENTYQNYLQMEHLKAQVKALTDSIVRHKRVTNVRTLCDVMNGNPVAKHPDL